MTRLIEEELNGASGILNFESTSDSRGAGRDHRQLRSRHQHQCGAVLQIITLHSTDGSLDEVGLGDFMIRNVLGEIRRIPGVGRAALYSTERSLRVWIDPDKLAGYGLTADDVTNAISAQYGQVTSGSIGAEPSTSEQRISALVLVKGQLSLPDEFGSIILRANADGSIVRLWDVARIEIGGLSDQFNSRLNGKPTAGLSVPA